jgi:hypothetical protein
MRTKLDYSALVDARMKRLDYADATIDALDSIP